MATFFFTVSFSDRGPKACWLIFSRLKQEIERTFSLFPRDRKVYEKLVEKTANWWKRGENFQNDILSVLENRQKQKAGNWTATNLTGSRAGTHNFRVIWERSFFCTWSCTAEFPVSTGRQFFVQNCTCSKDNQNYWMQQKTNKDSR